MIRLATAIVRLWVRFYTMGLEATVRERIRQEVEADLWEQINGSDASRKPLNGAEAILLRWIPGIPSDIERMTEEPVSPTMQRLAKGMRWVALTIVVYVIIFFFLLGLAAFGLGVGVDGIIAWATLLLAIGCFIISKHRQQVAGVLLVLTYLGMVTSEVLVLGLTYAFWPWSVLGSPLPAFGSPLLIASILFLLSGLFSRNLTSSELPLAPNL
jgi:hypothetical protein